MNYKSKIALVAFFAFAIYNKSYGQNGGFSLGIKEKVKTLHYDSYLFLFLPLDSIYANGKLVNSIEKELTNTYTFLKKNDYYSIRLGYYAIDSTCKKSAEEAFYIVKEILQKNKSTHVIKQDMVCSSSNISSYKDVHRYQKLMNVKIENCIVFSIYRTREKIDKYEDINCYF